MNRQARRKRDNEATLEEKRMKRARKWVNTLTHEQIQYINTYSDIIFKKQFNDMMEAIDRNFTAAMTLETEMSLDEINNIFKLTVDLLEEDTIVVKKLKGETGGDWMKAAEKNVDKIITRTFELMDEGVKQKDAIETLRGEFPKLSKSMITNAYKKAKEERKQIEAIKELTKPNMDELDPDVREGLEHIFPEQFEKKEDDEVVKKVVNKEIKKEEKSLASEKIEGLEILEETVVIKKEIKANTAYGKVFASTDSGITFDSAFGFYFKNREELQEFNNIASKLFEAVQA